MFRRPRDLWIIVFKSVISVVGGRAEVYGLERELDVNREINQFEYLNYYSILACTNTPRVLTLLLVAMRYATQPHSICGITVARPLKLSGTTLLGRRECNAGQMNKNQ